MALPAHDRPTPLDTGSLTLAVLVGQARDGASVDALRGAARALGVPPERVAGYVTEAQRLASETARVGEVVAG